MKDEITFTPAPNHKLFVDLSGRKFNRLTVLGFAGQKNRKSTWWCECECGSITKVEGYALKSDNTRSCGCFGREAGKVHNTTHGMSKTPTYRIWSLMISRCTNPQSSGFHKYGARGISVCDRWRNFENFLTDMGERPTDEHSIERMDNDGNYEPGNCRWATRTEQCNNRRSSRRLTFKGRTMTVTEWAREIGIKAGTLHARLKSGWGIEQALTSRVATPSEAGHLGGQALRVKLAAESVEVERGQI